MGLGILFPGQGSQHPGMFSDFRSPDAAHLAQEAAQLGRISFRNGWLTDSAAIFENTAAQPLMVGHSLGLWKMLGPLVPHPAAILGYSVGELAAASAAGALAPEAALRLATRRAKLMQDASDETQAMLAIRGHSADLQKAITEAGATIAIVNGRDHLVVAGRAKQIAWLQERLASQPLTLRLLRVTVASHSPLMAPAVAPFRKAVLAEARALQGPFLSAWNARRPATAEMLARALSEQIAAPLKWALTLQAALERGASAFLELGPGDQMTRIVRELLPGVPARSVIEFREMERAAEWAIRTVGGAALAENPITGRER